MTIGENLKKLRTVDNDYTQEYVAEKVGTDVKAIRDYEKDKRYPSLMTTITLADFYNVTLDELVCRKVNKYA